VLKEMKGMSGLRFLLAEEVAEAEPERPTGPRELVQETERLWVVVVLQRVVHRGPDPRCRVRG